MLTPQRSCRPVHIESSSNSYSFDMRYLPAKARKQGIYGKGPKAFTQEDRNRFVQTSTKNLSNFEGISK
jgi:uncharacterized protein